MLKKFKNPYFSNIWISLFGPHLRTLWPAHYHFSPGRDSRWLLPYLLPEDVSWTPPLRTYILEVRVLWITRSLFLDSETSSSPRWPKTVLTPHSNMNNEMPPDSTQSTAQLFGMLTIWSNQKLIKITHKRGKARHLHPETVPVT